VPERPIENQTEYRHLYILEVRASYFTRRLGIVNKVLTHIQGLCFSGLWEKRLETI